MAKHLKISLFIVIVVMLCWEQNEVEVEMMRRWKFYTIIETKLILLEVPF